jgi:hypothetical protein
MFAISRVRQKVPPFVGAFPPGVASQKAPLVQALRRALIAAFVRRRNNGGQICRLIFSREHKKAPLQLREERPQNPFSFPFFPSQMTMNNKIADVGVV